MLPCLFAMPIPTSLARIRAAAAEWLGAGARAAVRALDPDRGSNLPGRLALATDRSILAHLSRRHSPIVLVTGTNGKTTATALLAETLRHLVGSVTTNKAGANLEAGLVSALVGSRGGPACLEVDEGALASLIDRVSPDVVVFLNLSRDQLDRYGEIDVVAERWKKSLEKLPNLPAIVANADDPRVTWVCFELLRTRTAGQGPAPVVRFFGIEEVRLPEKLPPEPSPDASFCPSCGSDLDYEICWPTGGGKYRCTRCQLARPTPDVAVVDYVAKGLSRSTVSIDTPDGSLKCELALPGFHNLYNAAAAICSALHLGISLKAISQSLEFTNAAYGRAEVIAVGTKRLALLLSKNPQSLTQNLSLIKDELDAFAWPSWNRPNLEADRTAYREAMGSADAELQNSEQGSYWRDAGVDRMTPALPVVFGLNDRLADGRDVSWIWDADFGVLLPHKPFFVLYGDRAESAALRLLYEGWPEQRLFVTHDPYHAVTYAASRAPETWSVPVLATYTAMRELRGILVKHGFATPIGFSGVGMPSGSVPARQLPPTRGR
jgi:UDP-N-acetylmuramyl tripeptide synthase